MELNSESRMINSFFQDVVGFTFVLLLLIFTVLIQGDSLYVGLWYYFAVAGTAFVITVLIRPRPGFLTGVSVALAMIFVFYLQINQGGSRPDGLLVLAHLFSLPGALIGLLAAGWVVRQRTASSSIAALLLAMLGVTIGFFLNQLLLCRTLMYCGKILSG